VLASGNLLNAYALPDVLHSTAAMAQGAEVLRIIPVALYMFMVVVVLILLWMDVIGITFKANIAILNTSDFPEFDLQLRPTYSDMRRHYL